MGNYAGQGQLFPALTPAADMSYLLCRDEI